MNQVDEMRMDKWLFAVRLFKTRGQAADACRGGKIKLNDTAVKAAKTVRVGDTVSVRQSPIVRSLKVIGLTERRVGLAAFFREGLFDPCSTLFSMLGTCYVPSFACIFSSG